MAVDFPDTIKESISRVQDEIMKLRCDIKWVEKKNLHLTLKFLGEIPEPKIQEIISNTANTLAQIKEFDISFSNVGLMPNNKQPRVIFIDSGKGIEHMRNIAKIIDTGLSSIGIEKDKREFLAHLTLGRFRSSKNINNLLDYLKSNSGVSMDDARIKHIVLFNSTLKMEGPVYTQLARFELCN